MRMEGSSRLFQRTLVSAAVASCFMSGVAFANPTGPTVVNGSVAIHQQGNLLQITNSPNSIINWQSFSIGANEITRFLQQSASSAVLNRVITQNPSSILGALQSNGRVFLINPNGILFGAGSQVDVAGLVASTLNLSNADFLAGRLKFTEAPGAGSVINQGAINAAQGGQVYLVGPAVTNSGIITSPKGEVILAAGNSVELVDPGTPNLRVEITAPDNQAINLGQIVADSGRVGIYAGLINHSGTIRANSAVATEDGRIVLKATKSATLEAGSLATANGPKGGSVVIQSGDTTLVAGAVEAKGFASPPSGGGVAPGGDGVVGKGGTIHVLGDKVGLLGNASVNASGETGGGTVLVGGDYQGKNPEVQNAWRTYFGPDATAKADAITSGDGGKVIVWADDITRFYGTISARGGAQSGNGGFVETSGKRSLDFMGLVDTRAPSGATGTLLLDPTDITISTAPSTETMSFSSGTFADPTTTPSNLDVTTLTTQLGSSGVQISTGSPGSGLTGNGDINVNAPISYTSPNYLVFIAGRDINVNAGNNITNFGVGSIGFTAGDNINIAANVSTGGALSLAADGPVPVPVTFGVGAITRAATGNTLTAGTTLTLSAASGITATTSAPAISFGNGAPGSGAVSISNTAAALTVSSGANGGGSTTLTSSGPITFVGDITSAGTLTVTATENNAAANNHVTVNAGVTVRSTSGDVILRAGDNIELLGTVQSGTGAVTLVSGFGNADAFSAINLNGAVHAGTTVMLDATVGGAITQTGGAISAGGNIAMTAAGNITLDSTTPGPGLGLIIPSFILADSVTLQANAITQGANSIIHASQLTTTSNAGASLSGANQVGSFTATNITSGNIQLVNTAAPLTITGISEAGGGSVMVTNTGAVSLTGTVSAGGGGGVNLTSTGSMSESGGGLVSTTGTLTTNSVGGQTLNGANQVSSFSATNSTVGDIWLTNTAGTLSLSGIAPAPGANVTINNTGSLVNVGTLTLSGGSSTFSTSGNSFTNAVGGVIQGNGTLNLGGAGKTLTNSGTLSPGTSPGALTINGDLTMTSSSITNIEIQSPGVTAGTDYDRINVTGAAALDGTLNVTHLGGFSPSTGSFQIMTYATRSGDFATKNFPLGFSYSSLANATDYTLSLGALFNAWIGTTGDWSVGANWSFHHAPTSSEDAQIPDVAGAQTITVASGSQAAKSVVLIGDETLSLTGGSLALTNASTINGTLSIAGGTLTSGALLNTHTLNLSAGAINGSGSLAVTSGYTHTGGSINLGGSASITQALGNLVIGGPITAGSITATATNGTISQAAGAILSTAGQLTTSSVGGTMLNASNAVASFNATNASAGGIQFTNAAVNKLTVTGMSQTGGNVIVTADDLDITVAVNAGSSTVTLRPTTLARNINIESTPTGGLSLSPSEIGFITAGTLEIGRSDGTGTLSVSTPVVAGTGTLRLLDKDIAVSASVYSPGNLALNATNNVTLQDATVNAGGTMDVSATNNLSLTAVTAITNLLSTGAQTISAKGITLTGGGGTNFGAFISQTGAFTQSITAGSQGITLNAGSGSGGGNWAQINQTDVGGNQTIVVNGGNVALLGGSISAGNNAGISSAGALQSITVNDADSVSVVAQTGTASISSSGNQTLTIQGAASANALSIGSATAANSSSITGNNQNITAGAGSQSGSITILGGTTANKSSFISTSSGTQTVSTTGTLALTGGVSTGGATGCGPTGGTCADISSSGTGLQHVTANKIDMKGGDIGGLTGSFGSAGIFVSAGDMQLDVGAGGLVMQAGGGSATGNNGATIGGSNAAGRTLTLNVAGNTTLTGGSTDQSNAFIGLTGTGNANSITVNLNGTGDVMLTGGSSTNTGVVIGTGLSQTNATSTLTVSGKDITLNPGSTGEARIGHNSAAPGPGNISVTATGNIALNGAGAVASAIRTTGNVTLQASAAGKTISEKSAGRIVANNLTVTADSGVTLTGNNNAVSSIAITNNNAGVVSFKNTTALDIAAGNVTNTGRNVTLNNTGAVTDTGRIVAGGLELLGAGPYTLDNASNSVTTLAANTTGAITYKNSGALTVGTVNTAGITSGNNNVTLNAGGTVAVTQNIVAGSGAVNITATSGNIDGGAGTITTTGAVTLNGSGVGTVANPVLLNLGGTGTLAVTSTGVGSAGDVSISDSAAAGLNSNQVVDITTDNTSGQTITSKQTGAGGLTLGSTIDSTAFVGNDNITLIATAGPLSLGSSSILTNSGAISLTGVGVTQLAGSTIGAGTADILVNGRGGTINMAGSLATTSNTATAVTVRNATTVALSAITTGPTGTTTIGVADISGAVTQSGATIINTGTLRANTGSSVTLANNNNVVRLGAITAPGGFTFSNASNPVTVAGNISTTNQPVSITAGSYTQNDFDITAGSGNVMVKADAVTINANTGNNAIQTTGNVYLLPRTGGTAVSIGGTAGFDVSQTEINNISTNVNRVVVGEDATAVATAGAVTVGSSSPIDMGTRKLTVSGNSVTVRTNPLTSSADITLKSGTGQVTVDGTTVQATNITLSGGGVTVMPSATATASSLVSATGNLTITTPGSVVIRGSGQTAGLFGRISAGGTVNVNAGDVSLVGGSLLNTPAEMMGGSVNMTIDNELTLMGGGGKDAHALLFSNANFDLTIGSAIGSGAIRLDAGTGSGAWAKVQTSSKNALINLFFPTLSSGGYFVNGVQGDIGKGTTGFFTDNKSAKPGTTFFTHYGP
jgi:filamentous hemagglutinin family protein